MISVNDRKKYIVVSMTLALLFGIGIWNILSGKAAFGASLMGAAAGAGIMRYLKEKRTAKLKSEGLDPYDERAVFIGGLASSLTLRVTIFLFAIITLLGSVMGPDTKVNPYDLLGVCLAGIVLIYVIAFCYYSQRN